MELTGQCKEAFEKWFKEEHVKWMSSTHYFYNALSSSMKYGVYVDFFEANNIFIWVEHNEIARLWHYWISTKPMSNDINCQSIYTLHEARTAAIEKANELFNERS